MASRMTVSCRLLVAIRSLSSVSMSLTNMVSGSSILSSLSVSPSGHRSARRDSALDWTICFLGTWISLMSYSERVRCHLACCLFSFCYECPYFFSFSFSFPLLPIYWTPLLPFPFPLCCPRTSICLPLASWLLYLAMTHYDSFYESYLYLDLCTSDDSFYESSLYLAHDSYRL